MREGDRERLAEITSYAAECRRAFKSAQDRTFEALKAQVAAPLGEQHDEARRVAEIMRNREDAAKGMLFFALESENRRLRSWLERILKEQGHDAE